MEKPHHSDESGNGHDRRSFPVDVHVCCSTEPYDINTVFRSPAGVGKSKYCEMFAIAHLHPSGSSVDGGVLGRRVAKSVEVMYMDALIVAVKTKMGSMRERVAVLMLVMMKAGTELSGNHLKEKIRYFGDIFMALGG